MMRILYIPKTHETKAYSEREMPIYHHEHKHHEKEHGARMHAAREEMEELILPEHMERVIADVLYIMENKPKTWAKYDGLPNGLWEIIRMEAKECENAYIALKNNEKTHEEFEKELLHLGTAVLMAYKKMKSEK